MLQNIRKYKGQILLFLFLESDDNLELVITLGLLLVFGLAMGSLTAMWETLNLQSFFTVDFWYAAEESGSEGDNIRVFHKGIDDGAGSDGEEDQDGCH